MSKPISQYEKDVMARIDKIRENQGFSMEDFSEYIGVTIETYKRSKYNEIRADLDLLHAVAKRYPSDLQYILFGDSGQKYEMINAFVSGTDDDRARLFEELADFCRLKKDMKTIEAERLRRKARARFDVDYISPAGLVEKAPKRATSKKKNK